MGNRFYSEARLPFAPLSEALRGITRRSTGVQLANWRNEWTAHFQHDYEAPITTLAERLGVSRRQAQRWKAEGIPVYRADEAAVALGCHPMELWGDAWLEGAA